MPKCPLAIRFIDSATGYGIQPESVATRAHRPEAMEERLAGPQLQKSGHLALALERGRHTLTAVARDHRPMSGEFELKEGNPLLIQFLLDPDVLPPELEPEYILSLHREDATLILGFVVDEDTGEPLNGVRVSSAPSGAATLTDGRGFFQVHIPVKNGPAAGKAAANLVFERPGHQTQERQFLELWPGGDWTYRIRLTAGKGRQVIDERQFRRRTPAGETSSAAPSASAQPDAKPVPGPVQPLDVQPRVTATTNSTVRVPRNIRVLKSDGTIDYVTMDYYVKHVLPAEWFSSWGSIAGGSNSLSAGAVAIRCYAIAKLNAVSGTSSNDICATTSCQVYGTTTSANTDTAVNYTANYVVINSGGAIPSTEYSAENNSLNNACTDGFTAPTGGCLYDPVCTGETRYGHGRGMCQWGTAKWATGRKMQGEVSGSSTLSGYPLRDWAWIVRHYYPTLTLVKGAALLIGDDVKAVGIVNVNMCADGGITNGINCPLLVGISSGTSGTIVDGPMRITADGKGFTWYKIQWNDAGQTLGWAKENFIERVFSLPTAPTSLAVTAAGTNQLNLSWTDTSFPVETGFYIERAVASGGPWLQISTVGAGVAAYLDKNLYGGSTWYYRVRAYNPGGNSAYTSIVSGTTSNAPPLLAAIGSKTLTEGVQLSYTNSASASDFVRLLTDFEAFTTETANGVVMFRDPTNSPTTTGFLAATPDLATITDVFQSSGNSSTRVLRINCSFNGLSNPWLRLTTASATTFPNPVIDFTKKLRFSIYADKAVQVAVGCRETTTTAGTALGSNGGTTGSSIEWAGVTATVGSAPMPTRTVPAGVWTTLTFDLPNEPITSFSGGNGILSTASGLGVLEHLAIVPAGGTGAYNLYLDNLAVVVPRILTYSLGAGAPTNASLNAATGVFTWTPTEAQGPGMYNIPVIVTDNSTPARSATNTFTATVNEANSAPMLAPLEARTVYAGATLSFLCSATDTDLPPNTLTFSLDAGAPPNATILSTNGLFTWPTSDAEAGTANSITVRVTDSGSPPLTDAQSFMAMVLPRPELQPASISSTNVTLTWSALSNATFRVQFKDDLSEAVWQTLSPDITATNSSATAVDPNFGSVPRRFYRLLIVD